MLQHEFSLLEILASNRYITVGNRGEIDVLQCYIAYRVEWDLYEVCQESGLFCNLPWADFVMLLRQHKPARAAAIVVVRETLKNFYTHGHYNFDVSDTQGIDVELKSSPERLLSLSLQGGSAFIAF